MLAKRDSSGVRRWTCPGARQTDLAALGTGSLSVVREITDETFEAEVMQAERPVVIDFWAPWCGPCKAVEPVLADLADQHAGRVDFVKLNIDESPSAAARYDVFSIPTVILFEGGRPQETVIGARPRSHFERALARWLAPA